MDGELVCLECGFVWVDDNPHGSCPQCGKNLTNVVEVNDGRQQERSR
jgi:rubrerythrin